ncbi:hypothetical protein NPIL_618151 [Nephila pilipes]|uniref:Uncharacterized protein n=1 Tax=Nephila pilipes TaxID=299642 RepID=A0A8X6T495_NEPPI|nr:hypothetical protein NPIL_618151 [Nephila pilipes]
MPTIYYIHNLFNSTNLGFFLLMIMGTAFRLEPVPGDRQSLDGGESDHLWEEALWVVLFDQEIWGSNNQPYMVMLDFENHIEFASGSESKLVIFSTKYSDLLHNHAKLLSSLSSLTILSEKRETLPQNSFPKLVETCFDVLLLSEQ